MERYIPRKNIEKGFIDNRSNYYFDFILLDSANEALNSDGYYRAGLT
jgi:hypothetical protein